MYAHTKKAPLFILLSKLFFLCCWDSANINSSNKENQRRGSEWNLEGKFYVYVMWRKWNFVYMLRNILMPERGKKSRERKKKHKYGLNIFSYHLHLFNILIVVRNWEVWQIKNFITRHALALSSSVRCEIEWFYYFIKWMVFCNNAWHTR